MFYKSLLVKSLCALLAIGLLHSCSPIAKLYFGIKNPKFYQSNKERLEYYKPFYEEEKSKVAIYTLTDTSALFKAYRSFSFPQIYIQNRSTDSVYTLTCFEDIKYNIEDLNNSKLKELNSADATEVAFFKKFLQENSKLTYSVNKTQAEEKWDVYLVGGSFLGKKIRKRTLPVTSINRLNQINILDLSINKE